MRVLGSGEFMQGQKEGYIVREVVNQYQKPGRRWFKSAECIDGCKQKGDRVGRETDRQTSVRFPSTTYLSPEIAGCKFLRNIATRESTPHQISEQDDDCLLGSCPM
jgi:hypothetical protein